MIRTVPALWENEPASSLRSDFRARSSFNQPWGYTGNCSRLSRLHLTLCLEGSVTRERDRQRMTSRKPIRVVIVAPSLDILGGHSRQAVRLMDGLKAEPTLEVEFLPHNPRMPGPFRKLQDIKYVRTVLTTLAYWMLLVFKLHRYDIIHVFSASYYSYLLSV